MSISQGRRGASIALATGVAAATVVGLAATGGQAQAVPSTGVVVNEVYGGGGNAGATLRNDFVDDYAPIPDLVVRCGPLLSDGYARDPLIVAEVLSPSTMNNDRGRKAAFYQGLQTLRAYLIVYQDEARVEVWSRGNGPDWSLRVLGRDDTIPLPDLGGEIPVAALYDGIPL